MCSIYTCNFMIFEIVQNTGPLRHILFLVRTPGLNKKLTKTTKKHEGLFQLIVSTMECLNVQRCQVRVYTRLPSTNARADVNWITR